MARVNTYPTKTPEAADLIYVDAVSGNVNGATITVDSMFDYVKDSGDVILADGTVAMSGNLDLGSNNIDNAGNITIGDGSSGELRMTSGSGTAGQDHFRFDQYLDRVNVQALTDAWGYERGIFTFWHDGHTSFYGEVDMGNNNITNVDTLDFNSAGSSIVQLDTITMLDSGARINMNNGAIINVDYLDFNSSGSLIQQIDIIRMLDSGSYIDMNYGSIRDIDYIRFYDSASPSGKRHFQFNMFEDRLYLDALADSGTFERSLVSFLHDGGMLVNGDLTVSGGTGPATLSVVADSDNSNEDDVAKILLSQDGALVTGEWGFDAGNAMYFEHFYAAPIDFRPVAGQPVTVNGVEVLLADGSVAMGGNLDTGGNDIINIEYAQFGTGADNHIYYNDGGEGFEFTSEGDLAFIASRNSIGFYPGAISTGFYAQAIGSNPILKFDNASGNDFLMYDRSLNVFDFKINDSSVFKVSATEVKSYSNLNMNGNNITNPGTVDGVDVGAIPTTYLPLAGGVMTGTIDQGGSSIINLLGLYLENADSSINITDPSVGTAGKDHFRIRQATDRLIIQARSDTWAYVSDLFQLFWDGGLTLPSGDLTLSGGNLVVSGTVDGRDVAVDGAKTDIATTSTDGSVVNHLAMDQATYDAISTPDANTIYYVTA